VKNKIPKTAQLALIPFGNRWFCLPPFARKKINDFPMIPK
jgi:hypothetical protein